MLNVINDQPGPHVPQMQENAAALDYNELAEECAINMAFGALVGLSCSAVWGGNVMSHVATGMCAAACATWDPRTTSRLNQRIVTVEPRPEGEPRIEAEPRPEEEPELIGAAFGPNAVDVPHDDLRRRGIQP